MRKLAVAASLLVALIGPLLVANCSSSTSQTAADRPTYGSAATDVAGEQPTATALASAELSSSEYRISPRDILDVSVFQVPDLTKTIQVSDDGNISLPLIGKTSVGGKTAHQAEQIIGDKLRKKYLQSPQVSIFVKQYGQRVTVSGEVRTPRVLAVEGSLTLSQAVANAGGLGDLADPKRIHVARASGGRINDQVYNFEAIQAGQLNDPLLQGGDLVVAEQSGARVVFKNLKDVLPFAVLATIL